MPKKTDLQGKPDKAFEAELARRLRERARDLLAGQNWLSEGRNGWQDEGAGGEKKLADHGGSLWLRCSNRR